MSKNPKKTFYKLRVPALVTLFITLVIGLYFWGKAHDSALSKDPDSLGATKASLSSPAPRSLEEKFLCFNLTSALFTSWHKPEFAEAVKQIQPSLIRLPGGDDSNYWDWQRGGLIEDTSKLADDLPWYLRFEAREYTANKLSDYQAGLEVTQTAPLFVLNLLTADLESQLEMLRKAKEMGIPIKYIELGNEFYFPIPNYEQRFPTPQDYAATASQWISAIKQEFPETTVAVLGLIPKPNEPSPRMREWNQSLLAEALPQADAITLHLYPSHGLGRKTMPNQTYDLRDAPIILGEPFRYWQRLQQNRNYTSIPEDKQIWITEYNLFEHIFDEPQGQKPQVMGSWAHGMYAMAMSLVLLEEPRVQLICNHDLIGSSLFSAILASKKSFVSPTCEAFPATPWSLSATGSAFSLLGDATKGMNGARKINFTNNPQLTGKGSYKYPALYGWLFTNQQEQRAVIMNMSAKAMRLNMGSLFAKTVNYQQVAGDPRVLVTDADVLQHKDGTVTRQLVLPAYSVTELF